VATADSESVARQPLSPGPVTVTPNDSRYQDLLMRRYNKRLFSQPESVHVVGTTEHVVRAVNEAVAAGKRIAIRGGGHCLDGLVDNPAVQVIIDFTEMRAVKFDPNMNAFMIEPGATLGEVYRTLDYGWGVTLPGGVCPVVGSGGHITGNGFGALSRLYGSIADHLHAVEVVVVRSNGTARAVVATRESNDPNLDLWWALAGAGGGNFGVVTRFWMRSPNVTSTNPSDLLPRAPKGLQTGRVSYGWSAMTEADFLQLARNWGTWVEQNSAPTSPGAMLHGAFSAPRMERGTLVVVGQIDPTMPGAEAVLDGYLAAMTAGVGPSPQTVKSGRLPWLTTTIGAPDSSVAQGVTGQPRWKSKVAHLRQRFTDDQIRIAYHQLTRTDYSYASSSFSLTAYGGRINALAPDATATPHRYSTMLASVSSVWDVPADDAKHMGWAREFYRDLFAATGGVPVPNEQADGLHPNWPDLDLLDSAWNDSGMTVQQLLHTENYPRLQQIKAKWDPRNVFQHEVSVQLP
jgi:aclacinomycin oxidase